jgi:formylglycine-generating enzyme required for sulfatase activity
VAWWEGNSEQTTRKVGLKSNNELGFYDMSGNVWEWCRDWFAGDYYNYSSVTNPQGPLSGTQRVLRGGSWNLGEWHNHLTTTRYFYEPTRCAANVGFRIALQPAKEFFDVKSIKEAVKKMSPKFTSAKNRNFSIDEISFEMVFVDGGTFTMGCTSYSKDCFHNEKPAHTVILSDFYIGKWQVTQQLWTKVMGTTVQQQRNLGNPEWELSGEGDLLPMYYINYKECEEFCEKLNHLLSKRLPEGYKFALPTEAQWEYAARGGKKSKNFTYSGGNDIGKVAWYEGNTKEQVREVATKKKNELGIYDMSGNIWEWCKDWFGYYSAGIKSNPTGPKSGYYRILRGGSWRGSAQGGSVSYRFANKPDERTRSYGLRLVLVKE